MTSPLSLNKRRQGQGRVKEQVYVSIFKKSSCCRLSISLLSEKRKLMTASWHSSLSANSAGPCTSRRRAVWNSFASATLFARSLWWVHLHRKIRFPCPLRSVFGSWGCPSSGGGSSLKRSPKARCRWAGGSWLVGRWASRSRRLCFFRDFGRWKCLYLPGSFFGFWDVPGYIWSRNLVKYRNDIANQFLGSRKYLKWL